MDDIYNDLENYDEVDLINELRSENSDLKHRLVECTASMEIIQKDFDKLSAEFKKLEMNYSSLLKIARAEIKRKTDMITNLNIEKDLLVIEARQSVSRNKVEPVISDVGSETKRKKKKKRNKKGAPMGPDECKRDNSIHASETSSTATDNTQKILIKERDDVKSSCRNATKENDILNSETLLDRRGDNCRSPGEGAVNRRLSTLSRPPLAKLSSDEEFENMYSALGPKSPPPREPERCRKRGRDRSRGVRNYNASGPQDKLSDYPEHFEDQYIRNKANRLFANDRNITNRDKEYNEHDRLMNRDKQYNESDRTLNRGNYRKFSPERYRRNARELGDNRYSHKYDRHRRLESPPREKYLHRSRERRPYYDRERDDHKPGAHRYDHPDTHTLKHRIHGEYDEPQSKKPRVELHPNYQEDRRQSEQQYYKENQPVDARDRNCQSPDFSHSENEASNEPVITTTDSLEISTEERPNDPRVSSNKYVKTVNGSMESLQAVNMKNEDLQLVNKLLWNLEDVEVPLALKLKPVEISEELVQEMDTEGPFSMESEEVDSKTADAGVDRDNRCDSSKKYSIIKENRKSRNNEISKNIPHQSELIHMVSSQNIQRSVSTTSDLTGDIDSTTHSQSSNVSLDHRVVDKDINSHLKIEKSKELLSTTDEPSKDIDHETDVGQLELTSTIHKLGNLEEATISRGDKDPTLSNKSLPDNRDVGKVIATSYSIKKDNFKIEKRKDKKSTLEKTIKDSEQSSDVVQSKPKRHKLGKSEEAATAGDGLALSSKEFSNKLDVDEGVDKNHKNVNQKLQRRKDKKSPIEKTSNIIENKSDIVQTDSKSTKDKSSKSEENSNNIMHCKNGGKSSILQKILESDLDKSETVDSSKIDKHASKIPHVSSKAQLNAQTDHTESSKERKIINPVYDLQKSTQRVGTGNSKPTEEIEPKKNSGLMTNINSEKESESNVAVFRDFEHRVYSTRHIVAGDLELSDDDTNDEAEQKVQEKYKLKTKKRSNRDASKDKPSNSEDKESKRTRSKKEKEKDLKPQNKFSELFGDSSSLITPEDLKLATKEAHALPSDCCPPLCEEAQDIIIQLPKKSETEDTSSGSVNKKHADIQEVSVSNDTTKYPKETLNETQTQNVGSKDSELTSELKLTFSNAKLKEMQNANLTCDKNKKDLSSSHEILKEASKSNKKPKSKNEKRLSTSESKEEIGTNSSIVLVVTDNKENADCNDISDKNISSEMAKIFESDKVNEDKIQLNESVIEAIAKNTAQDVPNLAPAMDEPGLVKTVIISTGNQHTESDSVRYLKPLNALASSTPAKEIPVMNISETEPKDKQTACINVTIASEDSVSQSETDAPDVRINFYKRRRKVKK